MAKKKSRRPVLEAPYRPKTTLHIYSDGIKIPKAVKGKVGKSVTLIVKGKVVSQRLSKDIGRKQTESYDLEISKIKSSRRRKK